MRRGPAPTSFALSARLCFALGAACALPFMAAPTSAQVLLKELPQIKDVGIVNRRGTRVPLDLQFTDSMGRRVRLGEYFDGQRPVLLVMAYYSCPLLCTLVMNSVQEALNQIPWTVGDEFKVLVVSFDHRDTPEGARLKQQAYMAGYARQAPEAAWPFLCGDVENIQRLATAVGFHYRFIAETAEFSHPTALIVLTPRGEVHNVIEKVKFPAPEVRLALAEAADGKIGTLFERFVHFCFPYDPKTGRNTPGAFAMMRIGAAVTLCATAGSVAYFALARRRRIAALGASASVTQAGTERS